MLKNNIDYLKVIITGDFCPINSIEYLCKNKSENQLFEDFSDILKDKDLLITNLECPITDGGEKLRKIGPNLKASPISINALTAMNTDIACLANNHILDYKEKGLLDTIKLCEQNNINTVGAGINNHIASKPLIINKNGIEVAILNYAEQEFNIANNNKAGANFFDLTKIYFDIKNIKAQSISIILVIIHGGIEGFNLPSPMFRNKLRFIADLSPTAILCHHTHVPSGYEVINNVPIFYSLGNFIFDYKSRIKNWDKSYFVKLNINKKNGIVLNFNIYPFFQCKTKIGLEKPDKKEFNIVKEIKYLNKIINDDKSLENKFYIFAMKNGPDRLSYILNKNKFFRRFYRYVKLYNYLINFLHDEKAIFNQLANDSHREILTNYLSRKIF